MGCGKGRQLSASISAFPLLWHSIRPGGIHHKGRPPNADALRGFARSLSLGSLPFRQLQAPWLSAGATPRRQDQNLLVLCLFLLFRLNSKRITFIKNCPDRPHSMQQGVLSRKENKLMQYLPHETHFWFKAVSSACICQFTDGAFSRFLNVYSR